MPVESRFGRMTTMKGKSMIPVIIDTGSAALHGLFSTGSAAFHGILNTPWTGSFGG
ncbi:hypothetical protein [Nocardia vaccinii]|uniref:hypothetical protein n=1 Tax=Nocardia vaccinii TaxID=1822 RepID=UPI000AEDC4AF|nr:hypothetical protein [Nocardia vaccinii]